MKVSDLHESAAALDMIGDRTKTIQCKKCVCSQIAASNGRENDLQVGMPSAIFYWQERFPNALSKSVLTTHGDEGPFLLSQLTCEPIRSMIVVKSVLKHKTSENCLRVSKLGKAKVNVLDSHSQETLLSVHYIFLRVSFVPTLLCLQDPHINTISLSLIF